MANLCRRKISFLELEYLPLGQLVKENIRWAEEGNLGVRRPSLHEVTGAHMAPAQILHFAENTVHCLFSIYYILQ